MNDDVTKFRLKVRVLGASPESALEGQNCSIRPPISTDRRNSAKNRNINYDRRPE